MFRIILILLASLSLFTGALAEPRETKLIFRLSSDKQLISIRMSDASVAETLRRIARTADFTVLGLERVARIRTLTLEERPLYELMDRLLGRFSYVAYYEWAPSGRRLSRLEILAPPQDATVSAANPEDVASGDAKDEPPVADGTRQPELPDVAVTRELRIIRLLARRKEPRAVDELYRQALSSPYDEVRIEAARELEAFEPELRVAHIDKLLDSADRDIRLSALRMLGRKDPRAARNVVIRAYLKADDPAERAMAIRALGNFGDKTSIEFLESALDREVGGVLDVVVRTLERLGV
jgi:hypothetical protein